MNRLERSVHEYKEVLKQDSSNVEAVACIGTYHFYNDQPEIALRFYRWSFFAVFDSPYATTKFHFQFLVFNQLLQNTETNNRTKETETYTKKQINSI